MLFLTPSQCLQQREVQQGRDGSIGVNLMFSVQKYTANSGGVPKSVRGNVTILCIFKNKNGKELDIVAEECSGEVSVDTLPVYK